MEILKGSITGRSRKGVSLRICGLALVRKKAKANFSQEIKDIGKTLLEFVVKREINGEFV